MRIWAKAIKGEKILKDVVYKISGIETQDEFTSAMQEICEVLDMPTPVVTKVNFEHFSQFNNTRFKPRDFVESVDFDLFDVEAIPEKKRENPYYI